MDRNFARSLSLVLKSEGGWSDNPADPGGATMKGVTLTNFRRYVKPDATKADLKKITDAQVATVYRRFYWDAVLAAELPDGVDYAVFDFGVNSGPGRAAKFLQAMVGAKQDGVIGPATLALVGVQPVGAVIDALCDARMKFLEQLPTWPSFGRGWSSRVESVRRQALLMSAQSEIAVAPAPSVIDQNPSIPAASSTPPPPVVIAPQPPAPAPMPSAKPTPSPAKSKGIFAGIAAALALAAMAASGAWHHVTDLFWSIF